MSASDLHDDYYSSDYLRGFVLESRSINSLNTNANQDPSSYIYNLGISDGLRTDHLFKFQFDPTTVSLSHHGSGTFAVRKLVAEDYNVTPDHVCLVTGGASLSNHHASTAILLRGGYAFVEFPRYDPLESCLRVSHATNAEQFTQNHQFYINRREEDSFQPSLSEIKDILVKYEPRLLVFSNPHNPSGRKIDQLEELLQLVSDRNEKETDPNKHTYVLVDEVSRELPNKNINIPCAATLSKYAVSVTSTTKCFGLSGLRMGIIVADPSIIRKIACYATNTFCANSGLLESLWFQFIQQKGPILKMMLEEREKRRSLVETMFQKHGISYSPPDAGSIFLVKVPKKKGGKEVDDVEFVSELRKQMRVNVVSGSKFGIKGFIRLAYLYMSLDDLTHGLERFCQFYVEFQSNNNL